MSFIKKVSLYLFVLSVVMMLCFCIKREWYSFSLVGYILITHPVLFFLYTIKLGDVSYLISKKHPVFFENNKVAERIIDTASLSVLSLFNITNQKILLDKEVMKEINEMKGSMKAFSINFVLIFMYAVLIVVVSWF